METLLPAKKQDELYRKYGDDVFIRNGNTHDPGNRTKKRKEEDRAVGGAEDSDSDKELIAEIQATREQQQEIRKLIEMNAKSPNSRKEETRNKLNWESSQLLARVKQRYRTAKDTDLDPVSDKNDDKNGSWDVGGNDLRDTSPIIQRRHVRKKEKKKDTQDEVMLVEDTHGDEYLNNYPADDGSAEKVTIIIEERHGNQLSVKIGRKDPLKKAMDAFTSHAVSQGWATHAGSMKFKFDGDYLKGNETPEGLDMENGDKIDVFYK